MPELNLDKLLLFFFAVAPGVIAMQVYALQFPRAERNWSNSLLEVFTYSTINLTIWGPWWIFPLIAQPINSINKSELMLGMILVSLVSPALMAVIWYQLRRTWLHRFCRLDHPCPNGWDHFVRKHHEFYILVHTKDGQKFGGYFGAHSYASTYPHPPELYVERLYRVSKAGKFRKAIKGSLGCVIRPGDYERIEFLRVPEE